MLPLQSLADFFAFEQALTAPTDWTEEPSAILLPTRLQQAFDIIMALRRIAREHLTLAGSMDEYYQALFWHALNVVRFQTLTNEHKQQALVSAALLGQQMPKGLVG